MKKIIMSLVLISLFVIVGYGCRRTVDYDNTIKKGGIMYDKKTKKPFTGKIILHYDNNRKVTEHYWEGRLYSSVEEQDNTKYTTSIKTSKEILKTKAEESIPVTTMESQTREDNKMKAIGYSKVSNWAAISRIADQVKAQTEKIEQQEEEIELLRAQLAELIVEIEVIREEVIQSVQESSTKLMDKNSDNSIEK